MSGEGLRYVGVERRRALEVVYGERGKGQASGGYACVFVL